MTSTALRRVALLAVTAIAVVACVALPGPALAAFGDQEIPEFRVVPDDTQAAQAFAEEHPDREEVRIVAAAVRGGTTYCALRLRSRDDALDVLESPDLVPALLELLSGTLQQ